MKGPDRGMPEAGLERPGEGPLQRADRNMLELLQELRVAQTGVQILFAFLLSLSFTDRFARLDEMQRLGMTYAITYFPEAAYDRSGIDLFTRQVMPAVDAKR